MKKILTLMALLVAFVTTGFADTWTVAGSDATLFGETWNPALEANDMTYDSGTGLWTWTKENVQLSTETYYEFKVVKDHSWDVAFPSSNFKFFVATAGTYNVTITFDAETKDINLIIPDAQIYYHYYTVAGNSTTLFGESTWDPSVTANDMTLNSDGLYEWSKSNVALTAGQIEFKVTEDHSWDVSYPENNYKLTIPSNGNYDIVITFNEETKEVNAIATASIASVQIFRYHSFHEH